MRYGRIAEFENGKIDAKQINVRRLRCSAKDTPRTCAITPEHVADHDILRLSACVPRAAAPRFAAGNGSEEVSADLARLLAIALFATCLAVKILTAVRGERYAVKLPLFLMSARQAVVAECRSVGARASSRVSAVGRVQRAGV